jgi:WD40 repeat protein
LEKINYHISLAFYFSSQPLFFDGNLQKKPHIRKCVELPFQQTKAHLWDYVTDTLCDLDFIQAKSVAKMTYDLVKDFNAVLQLIPDNAENICEEKKHQARLDKYTNDLIAYAKGEIFELEVPESIAPWPQRKNHAEFERRITNPTRLDRLNDFFGFLAQEAGNLQNHANEFPDYAIQQAWHFEEEGPIEKAAENAGAYLKLEKLIHEPSSRPFWKPFHIMLKTLKDYDLRTNRIEITSDGRSAVTLSGFLKNTIILWDLQSGLAIRRTDFDYSIRSISMTPDGKYLLMDGKENTLILFDIQNWRVLKRVQGSMEFSSISITPDASHALTSYHNGPLILWDLELEQPVKTITFEKKQIPWYDHEESIKDIRISPDAKKAISGSNKGALTLWDLDSGQPVNTLILYYFDRTDWDGQLRKKSLRSVKMTPDGKRALAICEWEHALILWDTLSDKPYKMLFGHSGESINSIDMTPDGKYAISCAPDKTCRYWDLESEKTLKIMEGHEIDILSVCISPDGRRAVSGSICENLIIWDLERGQTF